MGTGYLIVQARTAEDALPISGVTVKISDTQGRPLHSLTTDESGQTAQISLDAVDRELSLDSGYTGFPYTPYVLEAEADGFNQIRIADVQIFDGENAIQPLTLTPMTRAQKMPFTQEIVFGKQAVAMTRPREPAGPLIEPRILRQVIIPNPITVHLGAPSSNAADVQVSFLDYVKNVASSEIYPTWPRASLEANIYAIITFALNRVFTQWYRSQGFSFDITNSTAYDQYFVYGRTIYQSISQIVDEIFNQYVRRQGQIAPFFTAFCNGTTATCAGLSQWGTVSLANQGYSTMQILRYYYPDDIEISQTSIITGIVISFPGTTLRLGSTGLAVQTIQTYLNRIRRNYPAIPMISDDPGVFGQTTQAAVSKFQSIFNMAADGVVGKATWNKISYIYVAVAKLAGLGSEGTALGIGTVPPNTILRVGASGVDVITLQYILAFISEFYPTIPEPAQDGIFGSATAQSVIAFQRMAGLNPDGIVGPTTWNALYDTYWGIRDNAPIPDQGTFEHTVQSGETLWLLARRFGTTVDAIKALNRLTSDALSIGQVLLIPRSGGTAPTITHTVRAGDTLWLLAQRYNTTVAAIMALNHLSNSNLSIGQVLQIPQALVTSTLQDSDGRWLVARRHDAALPAMESLGDQLQEVFLVGRVYQLKG